MNIAMTIMTRPVGVGHPPTHAGVSRSFDSFLHDNTHFRTRSTHYTVFMVVRRVGAALGVNRRPPCPASSGHQR